MSGEAFALVLAGAVLHAWWNLLAKQASGGLPFVWLYGVVSCVVATPLGVVLWAADPQPLGMAAAGAIVASAILHIGYSLVLQAGYRAADFSVVYPVARGTGPLFSVLGAVLLLGEWPSAAGWGGIALVLAGIVLIAGAGRLAAGVDARLSAGLAWGAGTGLFIAAYTLVDGWAMKVVAMSPALYYVLTLALRTVLLAPQALRAPQALADEWRANRSRIVAVGVLSPAAYTLVLYAMVRAPLSYVAPARELSMMIGTMLGARLLGERDAGARLTGAALMVAGVVMLALA